MTNKKLWQPTRIGRQGSAESGLQTPAIVPMSETKEKTKLETKVKSESKSISCESISRIDDDDDEPLSMTLAMFIYWIIPILIIAMFSRMTVDTSISPIHIKAEPKVASETHAKSPPAPMPSNMPSSWPTSYREVVTTIRQRRRRVEIEVTPQAFTPQDSRSKNAVSKPETDYDDNQSNTSRRSQMDAQRAQFQQRIETLKQIYESEPRDIFKAIAYADAMRLYDLQYHDGGSYEQEAITQFQKVVHMAQRKRQELIDKGLPTNKSSDSSLAIKDEVALDYRAKSADGLLCGVTTAQGKVYFMANMFEKAVESYSVCLAIEPEYIDALNARGSALIILGKYKQAGEDLLHVIERDESRMFTDAFQGLARILQVQEDYVPGGWHAVVSHAEPLIEELEKALVEFPSAKQITATQLNRLYHSLFIYHDSKTKNYSEAFRLLSLSYKHKLSVIPPWQPGSELFKVRQTMQIFVRGFWPLRSGSETKVPIFIIGFVRSGSTLLERVLDAHPLIVGTGENSVFNGRLPEIRDALVKASVEAPHTMDILTKSLAENVVSEMRHRWERLKQMNFDDVVESRPERFVDKMLTNYYNVGFIQLLYPNALILHVVREPMDTVFSAYKHEFPPGSLDYTSDFEGLVELYVAYREVMKHWEEVLPGRITHIRYEDMVRDMPVVARAIIGATGLPWDEGVLDFHRKKHAVNTLSTTQVRKGLYKDSLKSWMRYEEHLQPLVGMLGKFAVYDQKTTVRGYEAPDSESI